MGLRSYIAGEPRIELVNALSLADGLVAVGCFTEIIQWRKRIFVPTGDVCDGLRLRAAAVLAAVINILS